MAIRKNASLVVGLFLLFHTWGVWADVEVTMEPILEINIGEQAKLNCTFKSSDGVGGIVIHWLYLTDKGEWRKIYYQDATTNFVEKGTPFTGRISVTGTGATGELMLTINDTSVSDETVFRCEVNGLTGGIGDGSTQLRVFETPDLPTIEGVHTGISVLETSLSKIGTCEAKNGYPKQNITWYRDNTPLHPINDQVRMKTFITTESSGLFSVKSELYMKVDKKDKDAQFYCDVSYFVPRGHRMRETNPINVTVYYSTTAINVWVESPKGDVKEGDTVELQCHGNGNPSPIFNFKHQETDVSSHSNDSPNNVLVLKNVTRTHSGVYHCVSMDVDTLEEVVGNTSLLVNYLDAAVITPEDSLEINLNSELKASCNANSSLNTKTTWFKNGKEIATGPTLTLKEAVFDTAGTYECVVAVPMIEDMKTRKTLQVVVQGPPKISDPSTTAMEESYEKTVSLSCHAQGYPVPIISWTTSDAQVLKEVSLKTEDGIRSETSIKVTSDITALCTAVNDHGSDELTFTIKAIKPTTIATITTITTTATTTTTTTVKTSTNAEQVRKEGSGVVIAVIIILILLLAIMGSVLYFLYKKGKICGRSGKQDLTKEKSNRDIVVEMKSDNTEEAVLLGVNGEKKPPNDQ